MVLVECYGVDFATSSSPLSLSMAWKTGARWRTRRQELAGFDLPKFMADRWVDMGS